jgi:DNA-directed RNA polymerase specialized sigma24 family protein
VAEVSASFAEFMREAEPRVRRALVAGYGPQLGRDATVDAFEYAWEHWDRVGSGANPAGYVYRTGAHSAARTRRRRRRPAGFDPAPTPSSPWVEPKLDGALDRLSRHQRIAVVLIHGFGWTYRETADLLGLRRSTVQRHLERGMEKLRSELGVPNAVV